MLVDLVGDNIGIVLFCQIRDDLQLGTGKDAAAGVGGIAQHQRLGLLAERVLQHLGIKGKRGGIQGDINGLRTGEDGVRTVIFIEGGEDDHLVSGIGNGEHGAHHGLGGAAGGHDLLIGVDGAAHEAALLAGQCFPEILGTPGDGILVGSLVGHFCQTVHNGLGRIKIREALREVHRVILHGDAGHAADDGIGKAFGAVGKGHMYHSFCIFSIIIAQSKRKNHPIVVSFCRI